MSHKKASPAFRSLERALTDPRFEDISDLPNVFVDLRYGSTNNVLGRDVYGGFGRALLHKEAAAKFKRASDELRKRYPRWSFLIFDSLRPHSAQIEFFNLVKDTPEEMYFANPAKGSVHNYGFAIDLGLINNKGIILDMGTSFDDFTDLAQPEKETEMLARGKLMDAQVANRKILRSVMEGAGFIQLPHEWWHYDALPAGEVRAKYTRLE